MTGMAPSARSLLQLYDGDSSTLARQTRRWDRLAGEFVRGCGQAIPRWFSTPGRTEIGGNHTDHNHGKVLAAAVDLDSIAAAAISNDGAVTIYSAGYHEPFRVVLDDLSVIPGERGTTAALIRGIASRFHQLGFQLGGFNACIDSDVPVGSGLSSSASIEVLIATVLNGLYNGGQVDAKQIAIVGQYAENVHFGKPSGLMDQIACAVGGIVKIDFQDPVSPQVEKIDCDFSSLGTSILVVETGGSHADLTDDYAAIPREMGQIAAQLGRKVCRQISEDEILACLGDLRVHSGDRAILRALHFLQENRRVDLEVEALRRKDLTDFLRLIEESGNSSYRWLQNCLVPHTPTEQGIPLALALAERFVKQYGGACRVHGGGFAGTILVFLPHEHTDEFRILMESAFGPGCVKTLRIRSQGSQEIR
jgi:galactokinase